ncbi:hypothetical protein BDDG_01676 [Blastomyces dermatitidis ATCC 18188]|uniref:Uncharacterized protein n=1 Tax=Ajellomyces dermatitidis (strain ATCC 18188 / CBS 674.68) TaxID=653446 RepID=F2T6C5_AJEDA|nr:hypothetical protein BDDG_01676 [Blastomyces dermatitidis ATCC 18188]
MNTIYGRGQCFVGEQQQQQQQAGGWSAVISLPVAAGLSPKPWAWLVAAGYRETQRRIGASPGCPGVPLPRCGPDAAPMMPLTSSLQPSKPPTPGQKNRPLPDL